MIDRTFQHLPGIGPRGERRLWSAGISDWNAFLRTARIAGIGARRKVVFDHLLRKDRRALAGNDWSRFTSWPLELHVRALPHLERILYLDIETYGVRSRCVTIIALSDGDEIRILDGSRIDRSALSSAFGWAEAIVTFNGNRFDLPYLERAYGAIPRTFRIDLEPLCRSAGLCRGLKHVERSLGIERAQDLGSGDPLALWRAYRASADAHYLELLMNYTAQDVRSLPLIIEHLRTSGWMNLASQSRKPSRVTS